MRERGGCECECECEPERKESKREERERESVRERATNKVVPNNAGTTQDELPYQKST